MVRVNDSICIKHTDIAAVGRCRQCRVPFCGECQTNGPQGKYCSIECRAKHELFINKSENLRSRRRSPIMTLAVVAIIIATALVALHLMGVGIPLIGDWP